MQAVVLSSKGQLVIPKAVREQAGLAAGDRLDIRLEGGEIRLKRLPPSNVSSLQDVAGCLARQGRESLSEAEAKAAIRARLQQKFRP